ncbi:MAG: alpha/beta hydrolase [Actinomycetota bacterium]|nr:alpha/beta hydrolase [Actinomycetota bacterium]
MTDHLGTSTEYISTPSGLKVYDYFPSSTTTSVDVILVHGGMDRARSFRRLATQLSQRGLSTRIYDRRGYGDSLTMQYNSLEQAPTFEDHLHDLAEVSGEKPGVIFGHSIGGTVSLAAVARSIVAPRALITYESPLPFMDFWRQSGPYSFNREELDLAYAASFAKEFMIRMVGEEVWSRLPPSTREKRISEGPTLVSEMSTASHYRLFEPTAISIPALICCGSIAPNRHLRATEYLANSISGATARIVEGANHGIHLSQPNVMADIIVDFIQNL